MIPLEPVGGGTGALRKKGEISIVEGDPIHGGALSPRKGI